MLVEIRKYEIKPGRRDEFVNWFQSEVIPAMENAGMNVLGVFVGVEDPNTFYYLRGFESETERIKVSRDFYESEVWLKHLKDRALALESDYEVTLVRSTDKSAI